MMNIVQYIVVRQDLGSVLHWPLGAICAQASHAATAALVSFFDHPDTKSYVGELDRMHKVVLGIENEEKLQFLASKLSNENIDHYVWREQPENICTAIATRPYLKSEIQSYFKGLKLL